MDIGFLPTHVDYDFKKILKIPKSKVEVSFSLG